MKQICVMIIVAACTSVFARNIEPLDAGEEKTLDTLEALQWKSDLSEQEISIATNALSSSKDRLAEAALCVVVLHELPGLNEVLQRGVGPLDGHSRLISSAIIDGVEEGQSAIESLRGSNLLKQVPKDAHAQVREKANHIIAIHVARTLRRGEVPKIEWDDLEFSSFERRLLQYSKQSSVEATREIIRQLGEASVAGSAEYDLVRVLDSYDDVDDDAVLEAFKGDRTGVYGKVLLLSYIEKRVSKMTDEGRKKVKSILGRNEITDKRVGRALKRVETRLEK